MGKRLGAFLMGIFLIAGLAGCASADLDRGESGTAAEGDQGLSYPYTFTDGTGRQVTLDHAPERVAVLFSSYADIWQMAGGEIAVTVGDAVARGYAPEGTPLVDDGAGMKIDVEKLAAQEPDFVIATADFGAQVEACSQLERFGIPCAALREECFEDYLSILKLFTDLTGNREAYQTYGLDVKQEVDAVLDQVRRAREGTDAVSVLFIRAGSGYSSTRAKTAKDHFAGIMLEELGAVNIADEAGALSEGLSLESILVRQPDVILIVPQGDEQATRAYMDGLLAQSGWRDLNAVREGRCHYLSKELFHYKPNARWAEAYRTLARLLYPEIAV